MRDRHDTPFGPHLTRAKGIVSVRHRITPKVIREREGCSLQEAQKVFHKTVLRRAVSDARSIEELKEVLHELINLI